MPRALIDLEIMDRSYFLRNEGNQVIKSHAYLFIGSDEGKIAELIEFFRNQSECRPEDLTVISNSDESGKKGEIKAETIRKFLHEIYLSPSGKVRIGVIYDAEKLNKASANILLKTLEEPPRQVKIILVSKIEGIIDTIRSRCQIVRIPSVSQAGNAEEFSLILSENYAKAFKSIDQIVKNNETNFFLDNAEAYFSQKLALKNSAEKAAHMIEKINQIRKQIDGNANAKLALETIFLQAKESQI